MKYYLLFLSIALVFCSGLSEIDQISFGKAFLNTVDIQLKSAQRVDDLMTVLDQMRDAMNTQKEIYEYKHQEFQTEYTKDIDFYQKESLGNHYEQMRIYQNLQTN